MFKLTVEQILASIETLDIDEKNKLQRQLPSVLKPPKPSEVGSHQHQGNTVSGLHMGGGNDAFTFSPVQNGSGQVTMTQTLTQQASPEQQTAFQLLKELKHSIAIANALDVLTKAGAEAQVTQIETELKKAAPNKDFLANAINTLQRGLQGVQTLAEPTVEIASLVAKGWGIPHL